MNKNTFQKTHESLRGIQLFHDIDMADLDELISVTKLRSFVENQTVIKQDESGEEMFLIVEGSVNVRLRLAEQEDITIGTLSKGDTFGEIALFDQQPRTATIVTCEPSELLVLQRGVFDQFLMQHPRVAIHMLTAMARRLRNVNDLLKESLYSEVTSKLADTLRNIANAYGKHTKAGLQIEAEFDNTELSRIAGIPADVVTAQLRHWKKEGIVNLSHGYLTLVKTDALPRLN